MALEDYLRQVGSDIVVLLTNPPSSTVLDSKAGISLYNVFLQLATIFQTADDFQFLPAIKNYSKSSLLRRVAENVQEPRVKVQDNVFKPTFLQKLSKHKWQRQ